MKSLNKTTEKNQRHTRVTFTLARLRTKLTSVASFSFLKLLELKLFKLMLETADLNSFKDVLN